MFKKLASEALGLSDIGVIVAPTDYDKVDADDYLFHEDGEKIFFLIKSKKDEYCFTNFALIHVDGDSAVSSKRMIKRYDYASSFIEQVRIETAGTIDMDIELKFIIAGITFSIDVRKTYLEQLKDIYKSLISIHKRQVADGICRDNVRQALNAISSIYKLNTATNGEVVGQFKELLSQINTALLITHTKRDYTEVFNKYIHN
ncbi:PH domain-containing protein [uncultured Thiothrix sp.]|uniref:PH domain-containing protein n=1 Tax=uncultured Thiothrix sp. TaxID=223185 RepID=UPI002614A3B1|nr:PH domain-containing protein [uncultured Thiothrix sp.]HMT94534.1 PH domain-containing protein [Thiolinea sp.]